MTRRASVVSCSRADCPSVQVVCVCVCVCVCMCVSVCVSVSVKGGGGECGVVKEGD